MDLFEHRREQLLAEQGPLAARMRPRTLDEFVGQQQILGPGRLLRRAIQADRLTSLVFYGPPGCGKTTLARIVANTTHAHFAALNAVLAGVADIRNAVKASLARLEGDGRRTILFVDEVHRFNKSQQDALLPHVENGTLTLIGATTENPYFEVNKTLLSRSRIFELRPLGPADLRRVLERALADPERGYGGRPIELSEEAAAHLADVANGDARAALNALELAVETTEPDEAGVLRIDLAVAEESIQRRAVLYDKDGDAHFDTISAFIKSLRGSDPDAALYWMARMLYAGEDARFILRRMLIFAAEDIGLADPDALRVAEAAAWAFDYVGLPEGRFHLSEACLYLATAPKSNSTMALFDALSAVERERPGEVPDHLKDASRDAQGLGHGEGYLYPHAYRDHWVAQQYLPEHLRGRRFYRPGDQGRERDTGERVERLREAQQAALAEGAWLLPVPEEAGERLPGEADWRRRSLSTLGAHLAALRERLMALAGLRRDHLVLDARAGAGLLLWEAMRQAKDAAVWALAADQAALGRLAAEAHELTGRTAGLPGPTLLAGSPEALPGLIAARGEGEVRFDRILGHNLLGHAPDKAARVAALAGLLIPGGRLVLAEAVPRLGERVIAGLDWTSLPPEVAARAVAAEAAIYDDPGDPLVNWGADDLATWAGAAALTVPHREVMHARVTHPLTMEEIARWFGTPEAPGRLAALLGDGTPAVRRHLEQAATGPPIQREVAVAFLVAERPEAGAAQPRTREGKGRTPRRAQTAGEQTP